MADAGCGGGEGGGWWRAGVWGFARIHSGPKCIVVVVILRDCKDDWLVVGLKNDFVQNSRLITLSHTARPQFRAGDPITLHQSSIDAPAALPLVRQQLAQTRQ